MRKLSFLVLPILVAAPALARAQGDPVDAVWAIMTQPLGLDSKGCRGCHVGPDPGLGPYWGDDQTTVRQSIEAAGLVVGGRMSYLASRLRAGDMPRFGMPWEADDLTLLDAWLITYEPPPDPFDPVWALLTQPQGPGSKGCRGCHVGPEPGSHSYWGDDETTVRQSIEAAGLLVGGRQSAFAGQLRQALMPAGGAPWEEGDFAQLDTWLRTYEPPPDPTLFDPVWAIMTQPAGPDSTGCRGCHVGPAPALGPYWGDDEETVRSALDALGLTTGGRMGQLAECLELFEMPMNGILWGTAELTPLYAWLQNNHE